MITRAERFAIKTMLADIIDHFPDAVLAVRTAQSTNVPESARMDELCKRLEDYLELITEKP